MAYQYRVVALDELCPKHWHQQFLPKYFEHTLNWLQATDRCLYNNACQVHTLWQAEQLVAALPLTTSTNKLGISQLTNLTSFYACEARLFAINDNVEVKTALLEKVVKHTRWQQLFFGPLNQEDDTLIKEFFGLKRKVAEQTNWFESDILSYEQYMNERPSRLKNTLKRKSKKAESLGLNITYATDLATFERLFADYQHIYQLSWKGEEYSYAFIREVCLDALKANKLCFAVLTINNQPAAAQIWFVENQCASIFKLAYDPAFKHLSVGSLLSADISKQVIDSHQVKWIDFGMGNEPYKQEWMTQSSERNSYLLFNNQTFFGILSWIKRGALPELKQRLTSFFWEKK